MFSSLFHKATNLTNSGLDDDALVLWMTRGIPLSLATFDTVWKLILFCNIFMKTAIVQISFQLKG